MFKRFVASLIVVQCFAVLTSSVMAAGAQFYRFKVDGQIVIKDSVPAELAPLGYEVLNAQGMVVKRVARELTDAEIAERDRLKSEQEAHARRVAERKQKDRDLLRIYSTVADVDRALARKSEEVIAQKELQLRRIVDLTDKLEQAQQVAANTERRGQVVPDSLVDEIRHYQEAIRSATVAVKESERKLASLEQDYAATRQRLKVLSVYPPGTLPEDVDTTNLSD